MGAICDSTTGQCVCEKNFVGNPDSICMPPITMPICSPACGGNSHCEYGAIENGCVCNSGFFGNPYNECSPERSKVCTGDICGQNALCKVGSSSAECVCKPGFSGNPYIGCNDVDECSSQICAENAVCINTIGSFDCKCKAGFNGNPFVMCSAMTKATCEDPSVCKCNSKSVTCPSGFTCENERCVNLCDKKKCGPYSSCDFNNGQCTCIQGYNGNPNDMEKGCLLTGQCNMDQDCKDSEICFKNGRGVRKCNQGCSRLQCGPNSVCSTVNHQSNCFCIEGYRGNPLDLNKGCQMEERIIALTGCDAVACGKNEICKMEDSIGPVCHCEELYIWNPVISACEKPSLPECTKSSDCSVTDACLPDDLGVLKCKPVCSDFNCPPNSLCVAKEHRGECECLPGYSGHVNDRYGCRSEQQNECTTSAQCSESEMCIRHQGISKCVSACSSLKCGQNARCITNNHIAQCQCVKGGFVGDPYDLGKGCEKVPCVYNEDCPPTQLCNRMTHQCFDICHPDSCGDNAVCLVRNRASLCQCPENYRPNPIPDVECIPDKSCGSDTCHPTAICEMRNDGPLCKCPEGQVGDPYNSGCTPHFDAGCKGNDAECPRGFYCRNNRCVNPCDGYNCGINAQCKISTNGTAECACPSNLVPVNKRAEEGCIRNLAKCSSDVECTGTICDQRQCKSICRSLQDCFNGEKCVNNMCEVPCINNAQCGQKQACINEICQVGCRNNRDCSSNEACLENKCQDPCLNSAVCGPNALCNVKNHKISCTCPKFFEPNPTPDQGCLRVPPNCLSSKDCPESYECLNNKCNYLCRNNSNSCAIGERCINKICSKVCYTSNNCLPGEVCTDGICSAGCVSDADCPHTEICQQSKCKCAKGFVPSSNGCVDIDECNDNPCHSSAICENTSGSFKCSCAVKMIGDPYGSGCSKSSGCQTNEDCSENLFCHDLKCEDPCSIKQCANNAVCQVDYHVACK